MLDDSKFFSRFTLESQSFLILSLLKSRLLLYKGVATNFSTIRLRVWLLTGMIGPCF